MQSLCIESMMVVALFVGCNGTRDQDYRITSSNQSTSAGESRDGGCDFSSYAPVHIEHFDRKAIIKRVQPDYPSEAVQRSVQGTVLVKALVDEQGIVKKACAIKGDIALREAAEKAALQWKLKPGYGLAFARPKTEKNLQNFAQIFIVFDFKLDKGGAKRITGSQR